MPTGPMAESQSPDTDTATREPGAPVPKDQIDPELVKLPRPRAKIGLVTAAGMVFLSAFFLWKLTPDRRFGGEDDAPRLVQVADVIAGKVDDDAFVEIPAEPIMSHTIRATKAKGNPGLRVTPVRGSHDKLWVVLEGTGWDPPTTTNRYAGRLRRLADLPFASAVRAYAASTPRPVFVDGKVLAAAMKAGSLESLPTIDQSSITPGPNDRVAFDVIDPSLSIVVATFTPGTPDHAPLLDASAWQKTLEGLGLAAKPIAQEDKDKSFGQVRFEVAGSVADITAKLEGAKLWAARVEPVTRHHEATWQAVRAAGIEHTATGAPGEHGIKIGSATIPYAGIDLVGFYVTKPIPEDAYALIVGEVPQDYWYILPITIVVGLIGLLFLWALIRTVRRDLLPARA